MKPLYLAFVLALALICGSTAAHAQFASDNFVGTNGTVLSSHTSSFGTTWTHVTGSGTTVQLQSNTAVVTDATNANNGTYVSSGTPANANYLVQTAILYQAHSTNIYAGPLGRASAGSISGYSCVLGYDGVSTLYGIQVFTLGVADLAQTDFTPVAGVTYTVTLLMSGTTIKCQVQRSSDNEWLTSGGTWQVAQTDAVTATDATFASAGSPGIFMNTANNATAGTNETITSYQACDGSVCSAPGLAVSPTSVLQGSTGNSLALTGTATSWSAGTPGTPTFTASSGTITAQTVASTTGATLTYNAPAGHGSVTLTDPSTSSTATLTITCATQNVAVTDSHAYFSPYNWASDGGGAMQANNVHASSTYARSSNPGAYVKLAVTVAGGGCGDVYMVLDTTMLQTITVSNTPQVAVSIDGKKFTESYLAYSASDVTFTLASGLSSGSHTVNVFFRGVNLTSTSSMGDRWNDSATGSSVWKIKKFEIDSDATIASPAVATKNMIVYGDSITECATCATDSAGTNASGDQDATLVWGAQLARAFGAEVGIVGYSASGWRSTGYGNVPMFYNATDSLQSWNKYYTGKSRLVSGLFSPAPDYIVINHGRNDTSSGLAATITSALTDIHTAAPNAKILEVVTFDQLNASAILSATLPTNGYFINLGTLPELVDAQSTGLWAIDSPPHPNAYAQGFISSMLAQKVQAAIGGSGTPAGVIVGMLMAPF